ncbi:hypothetical protein [Nocardia sp. NPDC004722]
MTTATGSRTPGRTVPWLTLARFGLVVAATLLAFRHLFAELAEDVRQGSDIGYIFAVPVLGVFATLGLALRRRPELPIYDRQTDIIVGLLGSVATIALLGLLVQRYPYEYEVLHLDLIALPLFVMSMSILLFGLRPVFRFWPAWLLVLLCSIPTFYLQAVITLGGGHRAAAEAILIPAAAAAAIAAGRTRRRALVAAACALVFGVITLVVLRIWFIDAPLFAYQMIPPCVAVFATATIMYLDHRNWTSVRPLGRSLMPVTAKRSWSAAAAVVFSTVVVMLIPLPAEYLISAPKFAGLTVAETPQVTPGWQLLGERQYPWAPRYFGHGTSWTRQGWQAARGNPQWDKESRRRRIMVDIVRSDEPHTLGRYPEFVMYRLSQPRISPPVRVDLGHGVTARLNTVLDDRRLLSWTWLSWTWQGRDGTERISLVAADNHLPDAEFPQPEPSVTGTFENLMHQILRGNAVITDPESEAGDPDSEHKDRDMLTEVARAIVSTGAGDEH